MRRTLGILFFAIFCMNAQAKYTPVNPNKIMPKIDSILVEKQKHSMTVFYRDQSLKQFRIALGFSPKGHKIHEGDGRTPEGQYYIIDKNPNSKFHLSLKLSYPSPKDKQYAHKKGVNPGGNIMIHGLSPFNEQTGKWHAMRDWTLGCIAVTNEEIEEIFRLADIGTPVKILP